MAKWHLRISFEATELDLDLPRNAIVDFAFNAAEIGNFTFDRWNYLEDGSIDLTGSFVFVCSVERLLRTLGDVMFVTLIFDRYSVPGIPE